MSLSNKKEQLKSAPMYFKLPSSMIKKTSIILSSALLLTATCQANESELDSGFYAGLGLSYIATEDSGVSSEEIGATLIGGYAFSKYISSEVSLFNLGDHKSLGMKGTGMSLSAIGSYPIIEKLSLFAEFGAMSVDIDIDESQNIKHNASGEASVQSGVDSSLYVGFGAKYRLTDWTLVLKATAVDFDADVNFISAQAHYHF